MLDCPEKMKRWTGGSVSAFAKTEAVNNRVSRASVLNSFHSEVVSEPRQGDAGTAENGWGLLKFQGDAIHARRIYSDSDQWGVILGIEIPMWGHQADIQAVTAELPENLAI